jgi:hypothetical protein
MLCAYARCYKDTWQYAKCLWFDGFWCKIQNFRLCDQNFFCLFVCVKGDIWKLHADFMPLYFLNFIYNNSAIFNKIVYSRVFIIQQKESGNWLCLCAWSKICSFVFGNTLWLCCIYPRALRYVILGTNCW